MALLDTQISNKGFWLTDDESGHCFDAPLAEQLKHLFKHHDVIDLGCGPGYYTKYFIENGIQCEGWDGNPNTPTISNGLCRVADLTHKQTFDKKSWVLSLEVGEHIPKEYESVFVQNLIDHATEGIVLSWAIPNQPGDGHVNCQPNEYVISLLEKNGYVLDVATTTRMRNVAELWWFKNTVMCFRKNYLPKITFCIPSKSNLRYLKTCLPSIRENAFRKDHDIIVFVDSDEDGTVEWLEQVKDIYNVSYYVNPNLGKSLYGIGKAYDYCVDKAKTDVFMIFHADMMLGENADLKAYQSLTGNSVVCSTRIEPPLHPNNGEKILMDFGIWPEDFKKEEFNSYVKSQLSSKKFTEGIFAPWMMYKKDLLAIGGHDATLKSAREDSDIFNRLQLAGYIFTQPWNSLVYHLTGRGGQFQHGEVTQVEEQKSREWQELMNDSTREFIRKWGTSVKHTPLMKPIISPKYDIGFIVTNCRLPLLEALEPWCSTIYVKDNYNTIVPDYIKKEQPKTAYNLMKRIKPYDNEKQNEILVSFDASKFDDLSFSLIQQLPDIIKDSGEVGSFELGIFTIDIIQMNEYQDNLIICSTT